VRVLVTGIGGFAGRHLARHCAALGDEVHGLELVETTLPVEGADAVHRGDVTRADQVGEVLDEVRPDGVVHLAGAASVGRSFEEPVATWELNLGGTLSMLEALRGRGGDVPCVVVTSSEVYGEVPVAELPVDDRTPMNPVSPYGASKAAADLLAAQYRRSYGVPAIRVRAFNHIGPGQDRRFVVPSVAAQIATLEREGRDDAVIEVGNVETRRDFTDVRDMVRAYRLLLERGDPDRAYLACTGRSHPIRELIDGLVALARTPVAMRSDPSLRREGEQPDLYGSAAPLAAAGWRPEIPLEATLLDTLDWWRGRVAEDAS
jgi:GDP-4-dehydro-6-deoxy-D-mannose reductase